MQLSPSQIAFRLFLLASSCLLIACSPQNNISVEDAWIPEAPPTVKALAGYMEVENHHPYEMVLVGAESPLFETIEIHRTVVEEPAQLSRMIEQTRVAIAAGQRFSFKPGGFHLMLLNPATRLEPGQSVPVILKFSSGMQHKADFIVRKHVLKLDDSGWF